MTRAHVPKGAFELAPQVRSYEVGRDGCLRPANVLRYFEYLATEDSTARGFDHTWYERHGAAWVVREMRLRLATLPQTGERLRMATWVSGYGRVQAYREYVLWCEADTRLVARAQGRWAYVDRAGGRPRRIPDELSARIAARGVGMPDGRLPEITTPSETRLLTFVARAYEADSQQHINNAVYLDWLEEQLETESLPPAHAVASGLRLRRVHLDYLRPTRPGEHIHLLTHRAEVGHRALATTCEMQAGHERVPALRARTLHVRMAPRGMLAQ